MYRRTASQSGHCCQKDHVLKAWSGERFHILGKQLKRMPIADESGKTNHASIDVADHVVGIDSESLWVVLSPYFLSHCSNLSFFSL